MKYLLLALACLVSSVSAHASGKLIVQGTSYFLSGEHKVGPMVGFSVYEKLQDNVAINSWVGYGKVQRELETPEWFNMSHMVEFYLDRLTLGAGYKMAWDPTQDVVDHGVAARIAFRLWD